MLLCIALAALGWSGCGGEAYRQEVRPLRPGESVERSLASDEVHSYLTELRSGDFLRVIIESEGIYVTARVVRPEQRESFLHVVPWGGEVRGPLVVSLVAPDSGAYRLELHPSPLTRPAQSGRYLLRVDELVSAEEYRSMQAGLKNDPRVAWLREHAVPVRSVSPADEDFADLEPLKEILAGVRIVMLGEATHEDGATFLAKTRLVKFLHQQLDFDVLAFEAGLYDTWKAYQFLRQGEDPRRAIGRSVYRVWSNAEEVQGLLKYLGEAARSHRPLEVSGFDSQFSGSATDEFFLDDLTRFLEGNGIDTSALATDSSPGTVLRKFLEGAYWQDYWSGEETASLPGAAEREELFRTLERLRGEVDTKVSVEDPEAATFWSQVLASTGEQLRSDFLLLSAPEREGTWKAHANSRDEQMSRNLLWLARQRFPNRKIIVWAATYHVLKNPEEIDPRSSSVLPPQPWMTMGHRVWEVLGDRVYTLGFTAYEGKYRSARQPNSPVFDVMADQDQAVELEELLHAAGFEQAFLNFRRLPPDGSWLQETLLSRALNHRAMEADWTQVLDGVWFHREMKPATYAERE